MPYERLAPISRSLAGWQWCPPHPRPSTALNTEDSEVLLGCCSCSVSTLYHLRNILFGHWLICFRYFLGVNRYIPISYLMVLGDTLSIITQSLGKGLAPPINIGERPNTNSSPKIVGEGKSWGRDPHVTAPRGHPGVCDMTPTLVT